MPRVKRGCNRRARHKKVLSQAKGYRRPSQERISDRQTGGDEGGQYAYRDRRQRKRQFRALWIARINAAARSRPDLQHLHERPEEGLHRSRPQGAGRPGRVRQAGVLRRSPNKPGQNSLRKQRKKEAWPPFFGVPEHQDTPRLKNGSTSINSWRPASPSFAAATDDAALETAKARYLGKGGSITELLKGLGKLDPEARKTAGAEINRRPSPPSRRSSTRAVTRCSKAALEAQLAAEALDVTPPGRGAGIGGLHPVVRTLERIEQLFRSIGFDADGPEIETDFYNFTGTEHAREPPGAFDARHLLSGKRRQGAACCAPHQPGPDPRHAGPRRAYSDRDTMPELRVIAPGRVYRVDSDATHSPMFHQVEGLWIGENGELRRPEGRGRRLPAQLLRERRPAGAFPAVLLPVHRAVGRDRRGLRQRRRSRAAGWRSPAAE